MQIRRELKLDLSMDDFESIHEALAKVRSTSNTVTVTKDGLAALLRDYSKLINKRGLE